MKNRSMIAMAFSAATSVQIVLGAGATGPCTPPSGAIDIQPDQQCGGKSTVGVGKELTLKAVSLRDKDCFCGRAVMDVIDPATGVKWSISKGTFTGGDTGTPKTWKAPATLHTDLAVRLKVDDKATDANTSDDGGFLEVASLNLDVVKPNIGSNNNPGYSQCPSPNNAATDNQGRYKLYDVTGNRSGCTVDFSGLHFNESGGRYGANGCALAAPNVGSNNPAVNQAVNASNTAPGADVFAICSAANWTPAATCTSSGTIDWSITADSATYHNWGQFNFSFTVPNPGGLNAATSSRSWNQAL